jgi:hypothetical protein
MIGSSCLCCEPREVVGGYVDGGACFVLGKPNCYSSPVPTPVHCSQAFECGITPCTTVAECAVNACTAGAACGGITSGTPGCSGGFCGPTPETFQCVECGDGGECPTPATCLAGQCALLDGGDLVQRCTAVVCGGSIEFCTGSPLTPACGLLATCGPTPRCVSGHCFVDPGCARCGPSPDGGDSACPNGLQCMLGFCVCQSDGGCG